MPAPDEITRLVDKFAEFEDTYTGPNYNEDDVRAEFIDLFFTELGWDVGNRFGAHPDLRDVLYEKTFRRNSTVRQSEEIIGKRPDYTFRIQQGPKRVQ